MSDKNLVAVVDIETFDTAPTAQIASIGCVIVDVIKQVEVTAFYRLVDTEYQCERTRSIGTVEWWEKQRIDNQVAYNHVHGLINAYRPNLDKALKELNCFIKGNMGERPQVMGNGSEFDNVIIEHAMRERSIEPAWDHGCNQSLRSVVWMGRLLLDFDPKKTLEFSGIQHHALHDARHESKYLMSIIAEFRKKLGQIPD